MHDCVWHAERNPRVCESTHVQDKQVMYCICINTSLKIMKQKAHPCLNT